MIMDGRRIVKSGLRGTARSPERPRGKRAVGGASGPRRRGERRGAPCYSFTASHMARMLAAGTSSMTVWTAATM